MNVKTDSVRKVLLKTGIPMVLSMMLQALYNIVDSAFVSNMPSGGELALNALTLAFPVQMLMVALSIGTGVGANALVAKCLGRGDREQADRAAGNAFFLGAVISVLFLLFGLFGVNLYVSSQTQNAVVAEMAVDYLRICCICSFGIVFFSVCEKLLQATGRSLFSTIAQVAGAVTNLILDPIMIYGLLGCPALGVVGAAWATVIGQVVSFLLALVFHIFLNKDVSKRLRDLIPSGKTVAEIYAIGLPAIISQALMSVMTYCMNLILGMISEAYVTAYGLYYKIQQFILFAAFGLRDAITPVVSFAYGQKNRKRIEEGVRYGLLYTLAVMAFGLLILEIFADPLASAFGLSGETEALCVSAMRIISPSFLFAGVNIALQGVFQATEAGGQSLAVSVGRQALFVLPPAWGFAFLVAGGYAGAWLIWLSFLIAEGLTVIPAWLMWKRLYRKKIVPME